MFIVQIKYKAPLEEISSLLQAHRDFLDMYYERGEFIASGPMSPHTGTIVIAAGRDKAQLEDILTEDPFYKADIATHEIIAFTAIKCCPALKNMLKQSLAQ